MFTAAAYRDALSQAQQKGLSGAAFWSDVRETLGLDEDTIVLEPIDPEEAKGFRLAT